jgi:hypothetical protein
MMCLCGGCASCLEAQGLAADGRERCLECGEPVAAGSFCSPECEERWMRETEALRDPHLQVVTPTPTSRRSEADEAVIRGSILRTL